MVKQMATVHSWMLKVLLFMRVNGLMIFNMDRDQRNGIAVLNVILETLSKDKRQERANLNSMVAIMKEIS